MYRVLFSQVHHVYAWQINQRSSLRSYLLLKCLPKTLSALAIIKAIALHYARCVWHGNDTEYFGLLLLVVMLQKCCHSHKALTSPTIYRLNFIYSQMTQIFNAYQLLRHYKRHFISSFVHVHSLTQTSRVLMVNCC